MHFIWRKVLRAIWRKPGPACRGACRLSSSIQPMFRHCGTPVDGLEDCRSGTGTVHERQRSRDHIADRNDLFGFAPMRRGSSAQAEQRFRRADDRSVRTATGSRGGSPVFHHVSERSFAVDIRPIIGDRPTLKTLGLDVAPSDALARALAGTQALAYVFGRFVTGGLVQRPLRERHRAFSGFLRCEKVLHYGIDWRYICARLILLRSRPYR